MKSSNVVYVSTSKLLEIVEEVTNWKTKKIWYGFSWDDIEMINTKMQHIWDYLKVRHDFVCILYSKKEILLLEMESPIWMCIK